MKQMARPARLAQVVIRTLETTPRGAPRRQAAITDAQVELSVPAAHAKMIRARRARADAERER
jgi:hypothetical protein